MSNFQIIILSVFGFFAVIAVLIFSGLVPLGSRSGSTGASGTVVLWGTASSSAMAQAIGPISTANRDLKITYVQKDAATFDAELINALAAGTGPDAFFLSSEAVVKHKDKIFPIPYTSLPKTSFDANYVAQASMYLDPSGVLALPLMLDPIVLFYNASLFDAAGIASAPQYWDEVLQMAPQLTVRDNAGNITMSAIALGQYDNISNAKDIIALLMMQSGGQLVGTDPDGLYVAKLRERPAGALVNPGQEAVAFFTEFSNPLKTAYSWNKSLPNAKDMFVSGRLAMYVGHASELFTIQGKNPNLNFNVAPVPQIRGNQSKLTEGTMYGIAISKTSKNLAASVTAAGLLTAKDASKTLMTALSLAPVRRDIIAEKPSQDDPAYAKTFYDAALISRGWFDPDDASTDAIFRRMINSVLSGASNPNSALSVANEELDLLLKKR